MKNKVLAKHISSTRPVSNKSAKGRRGERGEGRGESDDAQQSQANWPCYRGGGSMMGNKDKVSACLEPCSIYV